MQFNKIKDEENVDIFNDVKTNKLEELEEYEEIVSGRIIRIKTNIDSVQKIKKKKKFIDK